MQIASLSAPSDSRKRAERKTITEKSVFTLRRPFVLFSEPFSLSRRRRLFDVNCSIIWQLTESKQVYNRACSFVSPLGAIDPPSVCTRPST